jgi:dihydroxy-acid dehydratase
MSRPIRRVKTIVRPLSDPIKKDSHLVVLYGNLAPQGAVAKITGKEGLRFEGRARVFNSEESALQGILGGKVQPGDVVVIRYEGPKGGPGMREMLSPTSAIMGKGLGQEVALITDGRFSGGSHGFVVGHLSPEAALGGPLALVKSGDGITIDAQRREITLHVAAAELKRRRKSWVPPKPYARRGALAKYARQVSSASLGAVTDLDEAAPRGTKSRSACSRGPFFGRMWRLQFRRDMCQALYSPKGKKRRCGMQRGFETCHGRNASATAPAQRATRMNRFRGRVALTYV